jgi:hypothetical protein
MAAATDCHLEVQLAREVDRIDDVGDSMASGNQCRVLVHQTVMDFPCLLVTYIGRCEELSGKPAGKLGDSIGNGWN